MNPRAAAEYYVLFRLAQMGYDASPASHASGDVVACSPGGTRVSLLRVRCRSGDSWKLRPSDVAGVLRNRAYVFVEFGAAGDEPACFVVPAVIVAAHVNISRGWPDGADAALELEAYRDAWHLLGLVRKNSIRSTPVVSPSSPSA
jgi:hypothetical protein